MKHKQKTVQAPPFHTTGLTFFLAPNDQTSGVIVMDRVALTNHNSRSQLFAFVAVSVYYMKERLEKYQQIFITEYLNDRGILSFPGEKLE